MASSWRVVLVEPANPLNIGFVARAMRASGIRDLAVVSRSFTAIPAEAHVTGVSAPDILSGARVVADLASALRGCASAVAFSRRPSALKQDEFTLPDRPALGGRTALVFGRESSGLTREETAQCRYLARIPNQNGVSLNLGQAVAVALFALTAKGAARRTEEKAASMDRLSALWEFVEPRLAKSTPARRRRVRQLFFQMHLDDPGASLLFSIMKELSK